MHRRLLLGVALLVVGAVAARRSASSPSVPRAGWFVGGRHPLDAARHELGQPGHQPAVPGARASASTRALFGAVGNLAGQNSLRNPRRTTATASALMIGLALACTMAIVGDSAKASVDKSVADNFVGDYVVSNVFGGEFNTGIADEMAGGRRCRATWSASATSSSPSTATTKGWPRSTPTTVDALALDVTSGSAADFADGTVMLQRSYADDHDLAVGDEVEVEVPSGTATWPVTAIVEDNPVIFFPVITTLTTHGRRRVRAGRQRPDRLRRARGRAPACRSASTRWSPTCRSSP